MIKQSGGGKSQGKPAEIPAAGPQGGFHGSPEPTVGIEIELPVLDRESCELSPGSTRLLRECRKEGIDGVSAELMQSMLEVRTDVCRNVGEARQQLMTRLGRVRNIATTMGYDTAMLGTHPSARATENVLFPDDRYALAENRLAWMIYHRVTFGMHVHVGVRSGDEAIGLINMLVQYLPHILAVSANSPFWQGIDTGLASARAALYGLVPHAGVPRYFSTWKDFRNYCQIMRDCKVYTSHRDVKWDIRPRADYGTIEFRVCDTPGSMQHVFGLAALARSMVIFGQRLLERRPQLSSGDPRRQWIAVENKWLATRYGLDAVYVSSPSGGRRSLRMETGDLIERVMPIADEVDDGRFLRALGTIKTFQSGADRQRRMYREEGTWRAVITDAVQRLAEELKQFRTSPSAAN